MNDFELEGYLMSSKGLWRLRKENAALRDRWEKLKDKLNTRCFSDLHTIEQVFRLIKELEQDD